MAEANKHMTHIEDKVFEGVSGFGEMLRYFDAAIDKAEGKETAGFTQSGKIDGAPSAIIGTLVNGIEKKPFVGMKSIFGGNHKAYYSDADIDADKSGDLANKLKLALKLAKSKIVPKGEMWQGDFLYSKEDLKEKDGKVYFKPNTLAYFIDANSPTGQKILSSEMGIAFHTKYTVKNLAEDDYSVSSGIDLSNIKVPKWAWVIGTDIPKANKVVKFSKEEKQKIDKYLTRLNQLRDKLASMPDDAYNKLCENKDFISYYIQTLQNKKVDEGKTLIPQKVYNELLNHILAKQGKEKEKIGALKTEKAQLAKTAKWESETKELKAILSNNDYLIQYMIAAVNVATALKTLIMKKLNSFSQWEVKVESASKGFIPSGEEGFAIADQRGMFVKLVDRNEFSRNNRSSDIIKGWESSSRSQTPANEELENRVIDKIKENAKRWEKYLGPIKDIQSDEDGNFILTFDVKGIKAKVLVKMNEDKFKYSFSHSSISDKIKDGKDLVQDSEFNNPREINEIFHSFLSQIAGFKKANNIEENTEFKKKPLNEMADSINVGSDKINPKTIADKVNGLLPVNSKGRAKEVGGDRVRYESNGCVVIIDIPIINVPSLYVQIIVPGDVKKIRIHADSFKELIDRLAKVIKENNINEEMFPPVTNIPGSPPSLPVKVGQVQKRKKKNLTEEELIINSWLLNEEDEDEDKEEKNQEGKEELELSDSELDGEESEEEKEKDESADKTDPAEESSDKFDKIAEFVQTLLNWAPYIHLEHFHERSGFRHTRLEELYEEIPEWADRISEYFDSEGTPIDYKEISVEMKKPGGKKEYLESIKEIRKKVKELNAEFENEIGLQNILGEIDEKLGQATYAFSKFDLKENKALEEDIRRTNRKLLNEDAETDRDYKLVFQAIMQNDMQGNIEIEKPLTTGAIVDCLGNRFAIRRSPKGGADHWVASRQDKAVSNSGTINDMLNWILESSDNPLE